MLNPAQKEAVAYIDGPLLILAGAGSGKTRVITERIANLINNHKVPADQILAITFTNKAAKEMLERSLALLENTQNKTPKINTFHAFCCFILRSHMSLLNGNNNFSIYTRSEQLQIIKNACKAHQISEDRYPPQRLLEKISNLKNKLILAGDPIDTNDSDEKETLEKVYPFYQKALAQNNAIDFDDMLVYVIQLFKKHPEILERYQKQYPYIHVDEYQDTNHIQYYLVKLLSENGAQLCVVGDFDQTIYSWRGAKVENILNFEKDFPNTKTVYLEENYRSTHYILDAANKLIQHNSNRKPKNLWTQKKEGDPITHFIAYDENEECQFVIDTIHKLQTTTKGLSLNDIAILYRTNVQSRNLEETFNFQQIPYRVIGSQPFYDRQEIRDILAYLRLVYNPHDNLAFARAIAKPSRRIGKLSVDKFFKLSKESEKSIYTLYKENKLPITGAQEEKIAAFFSMIHTAKERHEMDTEKNIGTLTDFLLSESGYIKTLKERISLENKSRIENLLEFISICTENELELPDFLNQVSLMTSEHRNQDDEAAAISLMTLHHAKGLEFKLVFIIGFEEGLLPYYKSCDSLEKLEEERRLAYVGYTRAKEHLYLVAAQQRHLFGDLWHHSISPFLKETPLSSYNCYISERVLNSDAKILGHLDEAGIPYSTIRKPKKTVLKAEHTAIKVSIGEKIFHKVWGEGVIQKLEGNGDKLMYTISFNGERRKLMAKYSPLTKV